MKHLSLVIPDLFPPQEFASEACAGLQLPALQKFLARGNVSTSSVGTLEDWLCIVFGAQSIAPVRAAADGLDSGNGYWLCADPVHLELQRAQMLLRPDVSPSQDEASAICTSLNEHFAGMGLHFSAPHPQRWYLHLETEPQMTTSLLSQVAWRDAKFHQPQGADALRWQRLLTEMQMLLHLHPLNQARVARGELMIGSLWLWGGGKAALLKKVFDVAGGDNGLVGEFAKEAGVMFIQSFLAMLDMECERSLWICDTPGDAMRRGDLYAWRETVQRLELEYAQPLLKALIEGGLQRLTLVVLREGCSQSFELTRGNIWKLWRPARSLAHYAV